MPKRVFKEPGRNGPSKEGTKIKPCEVCGKPVNVRTIRSHAYCCDWSCQYEAERRKYDRENAYRVGYLKKRKFASKLDKALGVNL